jgi:fibronectin-binding autotransporter adhesin
LSNSGSIKGGAGGAGPNAGAGGGGLINEKGATVVLLENAANATIEGGVGGTESGVFGTESGAGGAGVANAGRIGLSNSLNSVVNDGNIFGGQGAGSQVGAAVPNRGGAGGAGLSNLAGATILSLTNFPGATIGGGNGGSGYALAGGAGGSGISNGPDATIGSLQNTTGAIIAGGNGGAAFEAPGGAGGAGLTNSGTITTFTNNGSISGGAGGQSIDSAGGIGGAGIFNAGTMALNNVGMVQGGEGGFGSPIGAAGAAVVNFLIIPLLTNSGKIIGQFGLYNFSSGGAANARSVATIGTINNSGTIEGAVGGDAILSTGSIGPIGNSGQIIGNVLIDQPQVSITGGSDKTFGTWSGGKITTGGDLAFAGGNTDLADNITVQEGRGTVTNLGVLRLATPETIFGNFDESGSSVLDFALTGDVVGEYGALTVTRAATLDGELALTPLDDFHLAAGDTFNLMTFGEDPGSFTGVSLGGVACSATLSSVWDCGGAGFNLNISLTASGLDATVLGVPEPSTWTMLGLGFLGLGGLGLKGRRKTAAPEGMFT